LVTAQALPERTWSERAQSASHAFSGPSESDGPLPPRGAGLWPRVLERQPAAAWRPVPVLGPARAQRRVPVLLPSRAQRRLPPWLPARAQQLLPSWVPARAQRPMLAPTWAGV
jgi:hypothetical protein